jgi:succinate-semialdehyde dehydrogenase/glutarate-semialdehyde dehydrogenase
MNYQSVNPYDGKIKKSFENISDKEIKDKMATDAECYQIWRKKATPSVPSSMLMRHRL